MKTNTRDTKQIVIESLKNIVCVMAGISVVVLTVYVMFAVPEAETFLTFFSITTACVCMFVLSLDVTKAALARFNRTDSSSSNTRVTFKLNKSNYDLATKT
ncbi:MAG TPA: hypothetical protein VGD65_19510 [Chryseosolibacter sp.]